MFNNCMPCSMKCLTNPPYIELDNNTLDVLVSFTVNYTTHRGSQRTLESALLAPNQIQRLTIATTARDVFVYIYNRSTPQPTILLSGKLLRVKKTCFEANGTLATARCREVDC